MRKPINSKAITVVMDKEIIMIESDSETEEVGCRMLAICGPEPHELAVAEYEETKKDGMEIICIDDDLVVDLDYQKYLVNFCNNKDMYLLEDKVRESSPLRLMYNVDKKAASGRSKVKAVVNVERRVKRNAVSSVAKKGKKTENGRAVHKSVSRTVLKIKEIKQKKGDTRKGKKIAPTKKTNKTKKKDDVQRGRKSSAVKKEKEKEERGVKRNAKSPKILGASKRIKTENGRVVNKKTTQGKKREALQGRKNHVTKKKTETKSKSLAKDESVHKFKACKKVNEKSLSLIDKSYAWYMQFQRNSLTNFQPEQQVEDLVTLTDPDIIAISNHPFPDGGDFPFQASKDEKIIDLEDGIVSDDMFKTSFSKKLLEILRVPYDKMQFLKFKDAASLKRPLTRSRELRDGRDFSYVVPNEFTLSYLEQYPDFKKVLHRCKNDCPRALNLLRGFFFYLENIVYVGAFQPWKHEKHLMDMIK